MKVMSLTRLKSVVMDPFQQVIIFRNIVAWQKLLLYYHRSSSLRQNTRPRIGFTGASKKISLKVTSGGDHLVHFCAWRHKQVCVDPSWQIVVQPVLKWPCDKDSTVSLRQAFFLWSKSFSLLGIRKAMPRQFRVTKINCKISVFCATYCRKDKGVNQGEMMTQLCTPSLYLL